jgi:hypothetical protein
LDSAVSKHTVDPLFKEKLEGAIDKGYFDANTPKWKSILDCISTTSIFETKISTLLATPPPALGVSVLAMKENSKRATASTTDKDTNLSNSKEEEEASKPLSPGCPTEIVHTFASLLESIPTLESKLGNLLLAPVNVFVSKEPIYTSKTIGFVNNTTWIQVLGSTFPTSSLPEAITRSG